MKVAVIALTMMLLATTSPASAQELTVDEWIDQFVALCVGSGTSTIASGDVDAEAGITLKSLKLNGSLAGKVKLERKDYRLLTEGISNVMSKAAADQADKIRDCLKPVRQQLLVALQVQIGGQPTVLSNGSVIAEILSPDEEKIMKALSELPGTIGTGQLVETKLLRDHLGLRDIRLRVALRSLQDKFLIIALLDKISLSERGDQYALEMGYAE